MLVTVGPPCAKKRIHTLYSIYRYNECSYFSLSVLKMYSNIWLCMALSAGQLVERSFAPVVLIRWVKGQQ